MVCDFCYRIVHRPCQDDANASVCPLQQPLGRFSIYQASRATLQRRLARVPEDGSEADKIRRELVRRVS